jgi:hypothetical protein
MQQNSVEQKSWEQVMKLEKQTHDLELQNAGLKAKNFDLEEQNAALKKELTESKEQAKNYVRLLLAKHKRELAEATASRHDGDPARPVTTGGVQLQILDLRLHL